MDRALYRPLLVVAALAVAAAPRAAAADDPLRDQALKLNQVTGTSARDAAGSRIRWSDTPPTRATTRAPIALRLLRVPINRRRMLGDLLPPSFRSR